MNLITLKCQYCQKIFKLKASYYNYMIKKEKKPTTASFTSPEFSI